VTPSGVARLASLTRLEFLNLSRMHGAVVLPTLVALRSLPLQNLRMADMSLVRQGGDRSVVAEDLHRWHLKNAEVWQVSMA
jgi:hypothetical protein